MRARSCLNIVNRLIKGFRGSFSSKDAVLTVCEVGTQRNILAHIGGMIGGVKVNLRRGRSGLNGRGWVWLSVPRLEIGNRDTLNTVNVASHNVESVLVRLL